MEIKVEQQANRTRFVLRGALTEESDFTPIREHLRTISSATFDLGGLTRINSLGVHGWVVFMKTVPPSCAIELEKCPPSFIEQANMITNFLGRAKIKTLFLPYLCPRCGESKSELIEARAIQEQRVPSICAKCGAEMEQDLLPDAFFTVLRG